MRTLKEIEKDVLGLNRPVVDDILLHLRRDDLRGAVEIILNNRRSMNTDEGRFEATMLCEHWLKDVRSRARRESVLKMVEGVLLNGTHIESRHVHLGTERYEKLRALGRFFAIEEIEIEENPDGSETLIFKRGFDQVQIRAKACDPVHTEFLIGPVEHRR